MGYRKFHNTQSALIELTDEVNLGMDRGELTLLILFDLSKAFDTVKLALLFNKLRTLNFDDNVISWFQHYLSSRTHTVQEGVGKTSNLSHTSCGGFEKSHFEKIAFQVFVLHAIHIVSPLNLLMRIYPLYKSIILKITLSSDLFENLKIL